MTMNTRNLRFASDFWAQQAKRADAGITYVVATQSAYRVLANNMAVMLAGACTPEEFSSHSIAVTHARNLNGTEWDFDRSEQFQTMTYRALCLIWAERFKAAEQATLLANAFANRTVTA